VPQGSAESLDDTDPIEIHAALREHVSEGELDPADTVVEAPAFEQPGYSPGRTGTTRVIAPLSGQVNPPVGVLRAAAKGVFDVTRTPGPAPKRPEYLGDLTLEELAQFGQEGSSPEALGLTEPERELRPTLEIRIPAFDHDTVPASEAETLPGAPPEPVDSDSQPVDGEAADEFEPIGVKVTEPAQESGVWRGNDADPPIEARHPRPGPPERSYGMVAAIVALVAIVGIVYGLSRDDDDNPSPPKGTPISHDDDGSTEPGESKGGVPNESGGRRTSAGEADPDPDPESGSETTDSEGPGSETQGADTTGSPQAVDLADIDGQLAAAERLLERGRRQRAHQKLDAVLAAYPTHARALALRSNLFIEEQKLDDALQAAQASVSADPEYAQGHLALGVIRQERGETAEAVASYQRFLALEPTSKFAPTIKRQLRRLENQLGPTDD